MNELEELDLERKKMRREERLGEVDYKALQKKDREAYKAYKALQQKEKKEQKNKPKKECVNMMSND